MRIEFNSTIKSSTGFYIGDICYVLADDVYYDIWGATNFVDGVHHDPATGADFAVGSTEYGDGSYDDQFGHTYPVDAGVIGCVPYELINRQHILESYSYLGSDLHKILADFGYYVEGDTAVFYSTGEGEFVITIKKNGKVVKSIHINTRAEAEYDDYYEDEEEDN